MGIDICGGCKIAVPQPFLNFFHGDAVFQQKACAAVAQFVEPNFSETVFSQNQSKMLCDIIGEVGLPNIVDINVIRGMIRFATQFPAGGLVSLHPQQ